MKTGRVLLIIAAIALPFVLVAFFFLWILKAMQGIAVAAAAQAASINAGGQNNVALVEGYSGADRTAAAIANSLMGNSTGGLVNSMANAEAPYIRQARGAGGGGLSASSLGDIESAVGTVAALFG